MLPNQRSQDAARLKTVERLIRAYARDKLGKSEVATLLPMAFQAAEAGSADAKAFLGHAFDCGVGLKKDLSKAAMWYCLFRHFRGRTEFSRVSPEWQLVKA